MNFRAEIENHIKKGEIDKAVKKTVEFCYESMTEYKSDATLLLAAHNNLLMEERKGLVEYDKKNIERANIINRLLSILDAINGSVFENYFLKYLEEKKKSEALEDKLSALVSNANRNESRIIDSQNVILSDEENLYELKIIEFSKVDGYDSYVLKLSSEIGSMDLPVDFKHAELLARTIEDFMFFAPRYADEVNSAMRTLGFVLNKVFFDYLFKVELSEKIVYYPVGILVFSNLENETIKVRCNLISAISSAITTHTSLYVSDIFMNEYNKLSRKELFEDFNILGIA